MVRFASVSIEFKNGTTRNFTNIRDFNLYRIDQWKGLPVSEIRTHVREWLATQTAEREWEVQYNLVPYSLAGLNLIFGSRSDSALKIQIPEVRKTILHPQTEIRLEIEEGPGRVCVYIHSGVESWATHCFLLVYPASELLIPTFEVPDLD